jgi:hypothetical protein
VETDDSSGEVPLDTVRSPARVDKVSDLEHTRTSVLITANEHAVGVVAEDKAIDQLGEAVDLGEIGSVDGMEVVATIETTRWAVLREGTVLEGIGVSLGSEVPDTSIGIDNTSSGHTNRGVDVNAAIEISSQEGYVHVSRGNDISSLCIDLVEVVLRCCNVNVLNTVTQSIDKRLREDLLSADALEVAGQCSFPELAEGITSND